MTDLPEFSRPVAIAELDEKGESRAIEADAAERAALAARFDLPAIHALAATVRIRPAREKGHYEVQGAFTARLDQRCVRTLETFTADVGESFSRTYVLPEYAPELPVELELEADEPEPPEVIADGVIDIGELTAQSLSLALDPWPHKPGSEAVDFSYPAEESPAKPSPFAALKKIRRPD